MCLLDLAAMRVTTHIDAGSFLLAARAALEADEAANSLMLGVCEELAREREPERPAPCLKTVADETGLLLAAMMTPPAKLVIHSRDDAADAAVRLLIADLLREEWPIPGVLAPCSVAASFAHRWADRAGQSVRHERRQWVYQVRHVLTPVPKRGTLRLAEASDADLVTRWACGLQMDLFGQADREKHARAATRRIESGGVYFWSVDQPVSMAMKTRPTRRGIAVSGVYTPPEFRRRGYATACVGG